jgi:hypothetical protein
MAPRTQTVVSVCAPCLSPAHLRTSCPSLYCPLYCCKLHGVHVVEVWELSLRQLVYDVTKCCNNVNSPVLLALCVLNRPRVIPKPGSAPLALSGDAGPHSFLFRMGCCRRPAAVRTQIHVPAYRNLPFCVTSRVVCVRGRDAWHAAAAPEAVPQFCGWHKTELRVITRNST